MTLQELKTFLGTLTEEQLAQKAVFFQEEQQGVEIDSWDVSEEDIYWEHHGDCYGNLEQAKETIGEEWENEKDDLVMIPKGTITFHGL